MVKKIIFLLLFFFSGLFMVLSLSDAKDYKIKEYTFTWHVSKVGNVSLRIRKDQDSVEVILSSPGWKIATLSLEPSQAKAIGEVLAKTEDYYDKFKKSDEVENFETVPTAGVFVTFSSKKNARDFDVKVHRSKFMGATVLLTKDEALQITAYLKDIEDMAAYVKRRIKP